jgi:hypothetical protein
MTEIQIKHRVLRSIGAVLAGMVVGIVLSLGTDVVLHLTRVFPPWGDSMAGYDGALLIATIYRALYGVFSSYLIAPLARSAHATRLGRRRHRPSREFHWRRGDLEQRPRLRSSLVSPLTRRAGDAASLGRRETLRDGALRPR